MTKTIIPTMILLLAASLATAQDQNTENNTEQNASAVAQEKTWLGVWCTDIPEALRMQLHLPDKQGVLVLGVAPDSPAAKSGIAPHDVLLRAGDRPLTGRDDLVQAIETAKQGKLEIELIHEGKHTTIETALTKRPPGADQAGPGYPFDDDRRTMENWLKRVMPDAATNLAQSPLQFRVIRPGAFLPRDAVASAPLPANMKIVVSKESDQPAKIHVQRGEETWDLTEKELDKLPADVRTHVERMLGFGSVGIFSGAGSHEQWESRIEKRLERIEEMFRAMDRAKEAPAEE